MATRGSNPGERRGGRKKGTPNKKLTPRDVHTLARAWAIQEELEDHRPPPGIELSKEILGKFAHNCAAVAVKLMPVFKETGEPVFRFPGHKELWFQMMQLTREYARDAASYQSPTFRAVMVTPPPPDRPQGDDAVVINLKIFENTGTAVALREEMASNSPLVDKLDKMRDLPQLNAIAPTQAGKSQKF
jgi:hypothetical protein